MKEKPSKGRVKRWIANFFLFLLLLVGLALIFNEQIKDYFVKNTGDKYAIANVTKDEIKKNNEKEASFDFDAVESMSTESVLRAQLNRTDLPVIGSIAVPSVAINIPIFRGLDNANLLYGAGTLDPNQQMGKGNYALASHNAGYEGLLFTSLNKVSVGDLVKLNDREGHSFIYKVKEQKHVDMTDTTMLNLTRKPTLTLITCDQATKTTGRIIVIAELV